MPKDNYVLVRRRDCMIKNGARSVVFTGNGLEAIARALGFCSNVSPHIRAEEGAGEFSRQIWELVQRRTRK